MTSKATAGIAVAAIVALFAIPAPASASLETGAQATFHARQMPDDGRIVLAMAGARGGGGMRGGGMRGGGGFSRGAGGGARDIRGSASSSINHSGTFNRNTDINRNTNFNRNTNINVNNDFHGGGCYGCGWDDHYHPVARAAAVGAAVGITAAAIGSVAYSVPSSCGTVVVNGISYYQCSDGWYQPQYVGSSVQYVVVNPPQ